MTLLSTHANKLLACIIITISYMFIELIGGWLSGSLALVSDAAHMMTDSSALVISWVALVLAKKPANTKKTFGYYRFEILAAILNTCLLFIVGIYIFLQAIERYHQPQDIHPLAMSWIAGIGLVINIITVWILQSSKNDSLMLKGAYLEVLSDMLSSIGVIIGGILIYFSNLKWIDTIIAILISLWILPRSWIILKESINILLESVPDHINTQNVLHAISNCPGVINVHDLHIWSISHKRINLTAHVVIDKHHNMTEMIVFIKEKLKNDFGIEHSTLQLEYEVCQESHQH
ncbi:MAG: cobalt-zinc-cadmium efflux system protein [Pseudomonadota bacterium]|nr:cobalt-zinc-cadmium efflux system protein [Pseudomonadota bacterium]